MTAEGLPLSPIFDELLNVLRVSASREIVAQEDVDADPLLIRHHGIAQAVGEFQSLSNETATREESLRMGFLAHELRNSLAGAMLAHELVRTGKVGPAGSTSSPNS